MPSAEAYEAAAQEARKQARIHGYHVDGVVFAAGWQAGVAEGRRQAVAEAIRAGETP